MRPMPLLLASTKAYYEESKITSPHLRQIQIIRYNRATLCSDLISESEVIIVNRYLSTLGIWFHTFKS